MLADQNGVFLKAVELPISVAEPVFAAGKHEVRIDDGFGNSISAGELTLFGTAKVTNISSEGTVGTKITVNAAGFVPDEVIQPKFGTTQLPSVNANARGEVNFTFEADEQPGGQVTVSLYGQTVGIAQSALGSFKIIGQLISVYPIYRETE